MSFVYRNWTVHNLIGHPLSEVFYWISMPLVGKEKAENVSGWFHDLTIPIHEPGTGRG